MVASTRRRNADGDTSDADQRYSQVGTLLRAQISRGLPNRDFQGRPHDAGHEMAAAHRAVLLVGRYRGGRSAGTAATRRGYAREFDVGTYFLHDVPQDVLRAGLEQLREEADTVSPSPVASSAGATSPFMFLRQETIVFPGRISTACRA
jgi:hypothetical protein